MSSGDSQSKMRQTVHVREESTAGPPPIVEVDRDQLASIHRRASKISAEIEVILGTSRSSQQRTAQKATETGRKLAKGLMRHMYLRTKRLGVKIPARLNPDTAAFKRRVESWGREFDRIMSVDELSQHDLESAIDAAYKDQELSTSRDGSFCWANAVQSPAKVRKHYVKLAELAKKDGKNVKLRPKSLERFGGYS